MIKKVSLLFFVLFVTSISELWSCSPAFFYYYEKDGSIYYGIGPSSGSDSEVELIGVDIPSFSTETVKSVYYASDKNKVYYRGKPLAGVDTETVQFLGGVSTLIGADGYISDKNNIYFLGDKMDSVDVNTFVVIETSYPLSGYGKDQNCVFHNGKIINCDPSTFRPLQEGYCLDKNGIYFNDNLIPNADPNDYRQESFFIFSNDRIFLNGEETTGYDATTFEVLRIFSSGTSCGDYYYTGSLVKDKNGIYHNDKKIENIDAQSFSLLDNIVYKDKNGYYTSSQSYDFDTEKYKLTFTNIPLNLAKAKVDTINLYRNYLFLKDDQNLFISDGSDLRDTTKRLKLDAATFKPYARTSDVMLFSDRFRFYYLDWLTLYEMPIKNTNDIEIVHIDNKNIYIKNSTMICNSNNSCMTDVDVASYNYAVDCDLGEVNANGEHIDQYVFDKNNIYYGFSTSVYGTITLDEYLKLKQHIVPQSKLNEIRKKSLLREYNF